jgi:hypothetical protein
MNISVEVFGNKIGVNNNITEALAKKEFQVLYQFKTNDCRTKIEFILNRAESEELANKIYSCLNDPDLENNGIKIV